MAAAAAFLQEDPPATQTSSGSKAALLASESKLKLQQSGKHTAAWHNRSLPMLLSLCWLCLVYRLIILSRLSWSCATKFGYTHICWLSDCDLPTCWYNQEKKKKRQKQKRDKVQADVSSLHSELWKGIWVPEHISFLFFCYTRLRSSHKY